jgi:hypothetical protein
LTCTGRHDSPAPLASQYKSYVFYPRHRRLSDGHAREEVLSQFSFEAICGMIFLSITNGAS